MIAKYLHYHNKYALTISDNYSNHFIWSNRNKSICKMLCRKRCSTKMQLCMWSHFKLGSKKHWIVHKLHNYNPDLYRRYEYHLSINWSFWYFTPCCHLYVKYLFLLVATKLQDCCDHYNVKEKAEDCWDVLCEDKSISCANEPWVFFEQFPKKGCDQHAKNIKSCCKW